MENTLELDDVQKLRDAGLLKENETALCVGDLIVAENVITQERRVLDVRDLLLESKKRILKD